MTSTSAAQSPFAPAAPAALTPMQARHAPQPADHLLSPARRLHSFALIERAQALIVARKSAPPGGRIGLVVQHGLLRQPRLHLAGRSGDG